MAPVYNVHSIDKETTDDDIELEEQPYSLW